MDIPTMRPHLHRIQVIYEHITSLHLPWSPWDLYPSVYPWQLKYNSYQPIIKIHHIKLIWLLNWQHKLTASDNLGFRGLGVAMCIHLQTSKSSPAILWLSTRMRDSFALKNRTALFHALDNLCLLRQKWS